MCAPVTGSSQQQGFPSGIDQTHLRVRHWPFAASMAATLIIGLFLAGALFGNFGGTANPRQSASFPSATVTAEFPEILRNGEFFEMRLSIEVKQRFEDLQISISTSYLRDLTINTMIPAPSEETSADGYYTFSFGPAEPGDILTFKIDGQINPALHGQADGELIVSDSGQRFGAMPLQLKVFR
jgi:hypothetical protein